MSDAHAGRVAEAVLRTAGGRRVLLRMPAPAVANDDAEQLGLATPQFEDAVLCPVAFRKADTATPILLVAAEALVKVAGTAGFNSVPLLLESAAGVVVDDVTCTITSVRISQASGEPYCYCLTLRAPSA